PVLCGGYRTVGAWGSGLDEREVERERAPGAGRALDGDPPAVGVGGAVGDGEAEPGPAPGPDVGRAVERLEEAGEVGRGDADAVVAHGEADRPGLPRPLRPGRLHLEPDVDGAPGLGVLHGVREEGAEGDPEGLPA